MVLFCFGFSFQDLEISGEKRGNREGYVRMNLVNSEEEVEQWEALDLGDSELPSFLRPCKRKSPSTTPQAGFNSNANHQTLRRCSSLLEDRCSLIPGPAGTVQVAIRRKMNKDPKSFDEHGEPIPTQDFISKAAEEPDWHDKDFSEDPWLSAVHYIRRQGLLSKGGNAIGTPLSEIKSVSCSWGKVDQVVAIVKTCTPNGLGDIMVTLKDPTGTIDASVHRKVISESEFGRDIRVGAVVILNKVSVCSPSRSSRYLNITLKNVSKVITKDTPVLPKESHTETSSKNPVPMNENEEDLRMRPKAFPVEQGTTQGIMNSLRRNATEGSEATTDVEMEETNPTEGSNSWLKGLAKNQFHVRMEKTLSGKDDSVSQTGIAASSTTSNTQEQQLHEDVATGTDTAEDIRPAKKISRSREPQSVGESECVMRNSDEVTSGSKVNKSQPMASSSSVPQWTDEQLEELFDFD